MTQENAGVVIRNKRGRPRKTAHTNNDIAPAKIIAAHIHSKTPKAIERRAYRIREFNEAFRLSNSTTYKLISEGKLRTVVVGGRRLIPVEAAEALFANGAE